MSSPDGERRAVVLLAEDNENDVILTEYGFKKSKLLIDLRVVSNGRECLKYLRKEGEYADSPTPDMVMLDLNMPMVSGQEVMRAIAADPSLCHLPVIILTTSDDQAEILKMYKLRCSSYIVKPVDFEQFAKVVSQLTDYWFDLVVLPKTTKQTLAEPAVNP